LARGAGDVCHAALHGSWSCRHGKGSRVDAIGMVRIVTAPLVLAGGPAKGQVPYFSHVQLSGSLINYYKL